MKQLANIFVSGKLLNKKPQPPSLGYVEKEEKDHFDVSVYAVFFKYSKSEMKVKSQCFCVDSCLVT